MLETYAVSLLIQKFKCCVFVLCGMIECVGDDGVGKCRFSIDGGFEVCGCSVDGYV